MIYEGAVGIALSVLLLGGLVVWGVVYQQRVYARQAYARGLARLRWRMQAIVLPMAAVGIAAVQAAAEFERMATSMEKIVRAIYDDE